MRGVVGSGRLQLDGSTGAALRIRPRFSGSPGCDLAAGRGVGLSSAAAHAGTEARDSYAVTVERLRLAWPEVLDLTGEGSPQARRRASVRADDLARDQAGRRGRPTAPAHRGRAGQPRHQPASVRGVLRRPGRPRAEPVRPYWPKWDQFAEAFEQFYAGVAGATFTPDEPWTLYEMPELAVVVAGLNSTMAESHRDGDHYGWLGEQQLRWFADRLADYRQRGWLRLAAVRSSTMRTSGTPTTSTGCLPRPGWSTAPCSPPPPGTAPAGSGHWRHLPGDAGAPTQRRLHDAAL